MVEHTWPPPTDFWEHEFHHETDRGTRPALFKRLVSAGTLNPQDVLQGFDRLRRANVEGETTDAKVRVYVGEKRRQDLVSRVLSAPWAPSEEFASRIQGVVETEKFSLIINNLESTSDRLAARLGEFLQSIFANWGVPIGGCEQVAFIGNYSGTAFGVHEGYEDAFLIHLGPGVKDFYCWSQDSYTRLTGTTEPAFGDYRWMLSHADRYVLEAGDILFLPRRVFHVGVQNDFSVSVAVPLYTFPHLRLLARSVLPELLATVLQDSVEIPSPLQRLSLGWSPLARDLSPLINDLLSIVTHRLDALLPPIIADRWRALLSNGGWEVLANDLSRQDATPGTDDVESSVRPGALLRLRKPYRLCWTQDEQTTGRATVYLRGVAVTVSEFPSLAAMLARLSGGEDVLVLDFPESVDAFRALYGTGGLEVLVSDNTAATKE